MEKGGKGYTPLNRGASLKGKGDSSPRSDKVGRRVEFSGEGSTESGFRFSEKSGCKAGNAFPKGGKGDKVANGGKSSVPKEPKPLELKVEQELPENVKCLTDCEAADILQGIHDQIVMLSKDPTIKIHHLTEDCSMPKAIVNIPMLSLLDEFLNYDISDSEICVIANVCLETVDEAFALLPSLEGKRSRISQPLKNVLSELAKLKPVT